MRTREEKPEGSADLSYNDPAAALNIQSPARRPLLGCKPRRSVTKVAPRPFGARRPSDSSQRTRPFDYA